MAGASGNPRLSSPGAEVLEATRKILEAGRVGDDEEGDDDAAD